MVAKNASGLNSPVNESQGGTNADNFTDARINMNLNPSLNSQTMAYQAVVADRGTLIHYTGAGGVTLSFEAAATLGDGWSVFVRNDSAGDITLDPDGAELINGAATLVLEATRAIQVFCDGTGFYTQGQSDAVDGANQQLSNLGATAVNTDLLPDAPFTRDLGSSALPWAELHIEDLFGGIVAGDPIRLKAWNTTSLAYQNLIIVGTGGVLGDTITLCQTGRTNGARTLITGYDTNTTFDVNFIDIKAGNPPTCAFGSTVTGVTQAPLSGNTTLATCKYADDAAGVVNTELKRLVSIVQVDVAANSNTTFTQDLDASQYFKITFTSNCTLAFTIPSGEVRSATLQLIDAGTYTVTWPGAIQWAGGTEPTFTASGTDIVVIWQNGDDVLFGSLVGLDFS